MCYIAIENGNIETVRFPTKNGDFNHTFLRCLPGGKQKTRPGWALKEVGASGQTLSIEGEGAPHKDHVLSVRPSWAVAAVAVCPKWRN